MIGRLWEWLRWMVAVGSPPPHQWYRCPDCQNVQDNGVLCGNCAGPRRLDPISREEADGL